MGTSNFHSKNSGRIFSVKLEEEWDYDDLKANLYSELNGSVAKSRGYHFSEGGKDIYELRSYPSHVVGIIFKVTKICGIDVSVGVQSVIRSGYYEGCNLDWAVICVIGYNTFEDEEIDIKEIEFEIKYENDNINVGMSKIQARNIKKWIDKTRDELVKYVEEIYTQYSEPLRVVAQFSNGETIYEKV